MTGALSPVTALSSTEAAPSMTVPSPGMVSPAFTRTTSPFLRVVADVSSYVCASGPTRLRALTSVRLLRRASAWALARPSAIASAKLANSTVNHSHTDTAKIKPAGASPLATVA